jgi:hypothetical protein
MLEIWGVSSYEAEVFVSRIGSSDAHGTGQGPDLVRSCGDSVPSGFGTVGIRGRA